MIFYRVKRLSMVKNHYFPIIFENLFPIAAYQGLRAKEGALRREAASSRGFACAVSVRAEGW